MKKIVSGLIAGALLMFSGQALADNISRVGMKVGAEASVILNGVQLSDAIIVDSKAYAPVRDIAEAFGANVEFENASKTEKAAITIVESSDGSIIPPAHALIILKYEKQEVEKAITQLNKVIMNISEIELPTERKKHEETTSDYQKEYTLKVIGAWEDELVKNETELAVLQTKLADINAKISAAESAQSDN